MVIPLSPSMQSKVTTGTARMDGIKAQVLLSFSFWPMRKKELTMRKMIVVLTGVNGDESFAPEISGT